MPMRRYWLLKSEPSSFSFDDLCKRPDRTEHWDGVRNFQAQKFLKEEIRVGDRAFFYHSNIKEPAVVGIVEVVREGYPDWTALDPQSDHFDPRSTPVHPIWYMIDVRAVAKLPRPVTLAELKTLPPLTGMVLFSRGRLSVQPVREEEWLFILRLAGSEEI